jgi:hypothetical protein
MKAGIFLISFCILIISQNAANADRVLEKQEIQSILKLLTNNPQKSWLPYGSINALHEEYKAMRKDSSTNPPKMITNEYRMTSSVNVHYDGEKFFWQINITSRTESQAPEANNTTVREFDMNANANRIFTWDGQRYTMYSRPINFAIVKDSSKLTTMPVVTGPLTAGLIPWGYGFYKYDTLINSSYNGTEFYNGNQRELRILLTFSDGSEHCFVLAPEYNYAVLYHSSKGLNDSISVASYGNFTQIRDSWIPNTISCEKYKYSVLQQNLVESDLWNFLEIDANKPGDDQFKIEYEPDATIEYHTQMCDKSLIYRHSKLSAGTDSESLLADKMLADSAQNGLQNCATAAMNYIASKYGKDSQWQVSDDMQNVTTLKQIKDRALALGLYCRAVRTDVQHLAGFSGCQVLMHIPHHNHYVLLGNTDANYVRIIDLTSRNFLRRFTIEEFSREWSQGTALVVSDKPVSAQENEIAMDDSDLENISGGTGFACTKQIEYWHVNLCDYISGLCGGIYEQFYDRYGCEAAASGTCNVSMLPREAASYCITDPFDPLSCSITGDWLVYYIRACQ